jgi:hypothetical protein
VILKFFKTQKINFTKTGCGDVNRVKLAEGNVKWQALAFPGLNLWVQITGKQGA